MVFYRVTGAAVRAALVAGAIATPSLLLTTQNIQTPELVVFAAIIAAILVFAEYNTVFPSFVEFRDAPPLNRLRFFAFFGTILALTLIAKNGVAPTELTAALAGFGAQVGEMLDFPYSPVRLVVLMLPQDAPPALLADLRVAAAMSYMICLTAILLFVVAIRVRGWPTGKGSFNVWTNLPLFDPTAGGDVVERLYRDARVNIILGVLLPFIIPAAVKLASSMIDPLMLSNPHVMIWTIAAWAFLPASLIMRGIAMARIADLIEDKRRRTYAQAEDMQTV